ncbi:TraR/DksA family transcriptional regulator [Rubrivivax albus]|uniref:TraR/DksA family transcriptional regulator n=1 Tax=Rubrivivax albus TaxID=2499835 RepID=A0A437JY27_9BURK|nr:TraR/DksA C4-type zinc finger protein [Rubrivivax albus]RVT52560.1 TraR/DksA family transcriptional regulator [Rubrivivax albus]
MSTHLTAGQHALLEAELQQRQRALRGQLDEHLHGQTRAERAAERLAQDGDDAPQRAPELAMAAALTDREQRELEAVSAALQRLGRGEFGSCVDCGVDIPFDRLKVEPWAERCVPCATKREQHSR